VVSFNDWITVSVDVDLQSVITIDPDISVFVNYSGQYVNVEIVATGPNSVKVDYFFFYVEDLVQSTCESSVFVVPSTNEDQVVQVFDLEPLVFEISAVEDSGSQTLLTTPGFELSNCGQFSYTQMTLQTMVVQASDLQYSI